MKSATDTAVPLNSNCWQERRASDSTAYSHVTLQFHHSPTFNLFTDVSHSVKCLKNREKKEWMGESCIFLTGNKWGVGTEEQFQHGQD